MTASTNPPTRARQRAPAATSIATTAPSSRTGRKCGISRIRISQNPIVPLHAARPSAARSPNDPIILSLRQGAVGGIGWPAAVPESRVPAQLRAGGHLLTQSPASPSPLSRTSLHDRIVAEIGRRIVRGDYDSDGTLPT